MTSSHWICRLTLADGRSVDCYIKAAEAGYRHFRLPQRLTQLAEDILVQDGYLTSNQQARFNTIHRQGNEIRRKAERNYRKLSMGKVHWSPQMQQKWDRLHLYQLLILGHKQVRTSSRKVRRLLKKIGLTDAWKLSEADLQAKWYLEHQAYKEAKRKRAHQWRLEYLEIRLAAVRRTKKGNIKARIRRTRVQQMAQKEETRRQRKAQGKGFSGGLQQIKVAQVAQDGTSHWVTCQSKCIVEEGCMQENRLQYDQTRYPYPTPPMTAPLYSDFNGPNAKRNSQALLRGLYDAETADPYLMSFLDHCRRATGSGPGGHVSFWRKMGEHKGSEPHGLHNGHFKVGVASNLLACCDTLFCSIPFATGFVPVQW
ncbi:unnamed protein product [Cylindrotheca closterium]|uniref:Uncharacterized protein n=1 Tax=Cylindrotheca closterium TaxID=2856 RepID=A0AAD2CYL8_9STRA|nr:unnamed protein product [Cylindrotheca closterium]